MRPAGGCRGGLMVLGITLSVPALLRGYAREVARGGWVGRPGDGGSDGPMEENERRVLYAAIESVDKGWKCGTAPGSTPTPAPGLPSRFRRDDGTWRRELYKASRGTQTSSEPTSRNLQSNQKSQMQQRIEVVKKSPVSDLREKLSGVPSQRPQLSSTVQVPKPVKEVIKSDKPVQKRDPPPTAAPIVIKKVSAPAPEPAPSALPKQSQDKVDASLDSLLKSLDLEKYLINFQAEEVDMKALVYMNEEDMKSLGIPMGPRKKILSALAHRKRKSSKSLPTSTS